MDYLLGYTIGINDWVRSASRSIVSFVHNTNQPNIITSTHAAHSFP